MQQLSVECGVRLVSPAPIETSKEAVARAFHPLPVPPHLLQANGQLLCTRSGILGAFVGVGKERNGRDVLMLSIDGFNGAVPFIANRSFLDRWAPIPPPVLAPAGSTIVLKPATSRQISPISSLYHKPLDLFAVIDSGVLPMSFIIHEGRRLLILGVEPISGLYIARDPASLDIVTLLPKTKVLVVSQRNALPMQKMTAGKPREVTYRKVLEKPDDRIVPAFPYLRGVRQSKVRLFDADPERCFRYFGIVPGERTSHPVESTAIGCTLGDGMVQLWFHVDGSEGAGLYQDGDVVTMSGEVISLVPAKSLRPIVPAIPRPASAAREWTVPKLTDTMCAAMQFTTPFIARSGLIVLLDISDSALLPLGFRHGQVITDDESLHALVGVGRDSDGAFEVWILPEDSSTVVVNRAGEKLKLYDATHPVPQAQAARALVYHPIENLKHIALQLTFPYQLGRETTRAVMLDNNPLRCRALFGLVPGQRVSGNATVVGMGYDSDKKVDLYFHADGHRGCGTFSPNTRITAEDVFVQVEPMIASTITYTPVKERTEDPLVLNFWFPAGMGAESQPVQFDADPARCKRYFGLIPGQRVDSIATVVGMKVNEGLVCLFFLADGHNGAGLFESGKILSFDPEEPLDILDPMFVDEKMVYVVRKVPINASDPLKQLFPCKFGIEKTCVVWIDADPQRCRRYLGIVPGQRASNATFIGLRPDSDEPGYVEQIWHADGRNGAGAFNIGHTLLLEDDIVAVKPMQPTGSNRFIQQPTGPMRSVVVPKLNRDASAYSFTFTFFHKGIVLKADTTAVEKLIGIKHGQPLLFQKDIIGCFIGAAIDPRDATRDVECFVLANGGEAMMIRPGAVISVPESAPLHPLAPVVTRSIVYKSKEVKAENPLDCSFSYMVGPQGKSAFRMLDADPSRCRDYFGVVPGQRVDGLATAIGMMPTRGRLIDMMFHVDGAPGAGTYTEGTELFVQEGEIVPIAEMSAADDRLVRLRSEMEESESMMYEPSSSELAAGEDSVPAYCDQFPPQFLSNQVALSRIKATSYEESRGHILQIVAKLEGLGHDDAEMTLFKMLTHLQHQVPIVTWFSPHKLVQGKPVVDRLTDDVMMRTLFETKDGNGNKNLDARKGWEDALFADAYGASALPVERPKYGLLNIFNDPRGPLVERNQYGDCFLVFSPELRQFCTMTAFDSSGVSTRSCNVCTLFDGQGKVFSQFKEEGKEIETFARVSSGRCAFASSDGTFYKELQVHANVFFQQHITHVVVHNRYLTRMADLHLLFNFAKKNNALLVSVRTLTKVGKMRSWSVDRLAQEAASRGIDDPLHAAVTNSLVLAGPHEAKARRIFRAILDDSCRRDMLEMELKLAESGNTTWRSSNNSKKQPESKPRPKRDERLPECPTQ